MKAPRVVVAGVIKRGEMYLLTKEKLKTGEKWVVPGGGVDFGETCVDAVIRELDEELGVTVSNIKFITFKEAVFAAYDYHTIIFFYTCDTNDVPTIIEPSILEIGFFTREQIKNMPLVDSAQWLFDNFDF
jgi:ADP-ribose pyrophosphatase YjhB (NUDIX family)